MEAASVSAPPRRRTVPRLSLTHKGITRKLRQQGGTTVFAIPPLFLTELGLEAGAEVEVSVVDGKLVAEPKVAPSLHRHRYTLAELLQGAEHLPELYAGTEGALDSRTVGQEIG